MTAAQHRAAGLGTDSGERSLAEADLVATLADTAEPVAYLRSLLRDRDRELTRLFRAGVHASTLVKRRAALMDDVLIAAWRRQLPDLDPTLALVAVGGYGRAELHPGSDIDLLLLLQHQPDEVRVRRIRDFVAFLWDIGLEVGHSVRTVDECVIEAERDITVVTNLMEARLIDGPAELFSEMRRRTSRHQIWPSDKFFAAKWKEQLPRHQKFGDTAFNLEPNVKEGPGGLRDIQMIGWVVKRHFGAETLRDLVTHGFLTDAEYQSLCEEQDFLWQVRFALHVLAGRREDRLLFDHQRALAEQFGYRDNEQGLAVEQFMKRYYRSIGELERLNEMPLELFQEVILFTREPTRIEPVNRRFQKRFQSKNGFLEVTSDRVFKRYPFALLELFLVMQQEPELKGVRATTIRLVRDHRVLIDEKFRNDIRARSLFLEILRQPRGLTSELRRMHRYGVLSAFLPVFGRIVGQMQYDLFHVYTVDEHSLFVVQNLRQFAVPERQHEFPLCSRLFQRLPKPELLYLAGLFHDIAKGRGGDHSQLGADDAYAFCSYLGLGEYDCRLVAWLVRYHLIMSVSAQKQDIHDPEVVNAFAARVRDQIHLNYLYLLTVADIRATNPKLWTHWKDALLRDLYESTLRTLRRGLENPLEKQELIAETKRATRRLLRRVVRDADRLEQLWCNLSDDYFLRSTPDEIAWHTRAIMKIRDSTRPVVLVRQGKRGTEIFVHTRDQEFLFAATTSILARLRLTILDARIITSESGMTFDSYIVTEEDGGNAAARERALEIRNTLRAKLVRPRDSVTPVHRLPNRQLKHFSVPTRVTFYPDEPNNRTILEVSTVDRPGLLSRIACTLADTEVRLHNAKIATFGERAEDIFFVTDGKGRALTAERCRFVGDKVREVLADRDGSDSRACR